MNSDRCIIVGSGISAIITALTLLQKGHSITLVSKNSDPRKHTSHSSDEGASWGGEHTRCVTPFESHSFLSPTPLHPFIDQTFRSLLDGSGWLTKDFSDYSPQEQAWLEKRYYHIDHATSHDCSNAYHQEHNMLSMGLWDKLRQTLPDLFTHTGIRDTILDIYETEEQFLYAHTLYKQHDLLLEAIPYNTIKDRFPYLAKSVQNKCIYGILHVKGFSFDMQRFMINVLDYMEAHRVEFLFDTTVTSLVTNEAKHVDSLSVEYASGESGFLSAPYYTLHVGAYDSESILESTPAAGKIHGVVGRWLRIPLRDSDHIAHSMKFHITAPDHAHHMNLALWHDSAGSLWLLCGAGHAYVGQDISYFTDEHRQIMDMRNHNAVKRILPCLYKRAEQEGTIMASDKECIRSWTVDDLPIFDTMPTTLGGKLVITGGAGTGTASLAPIEAQKIQDILA